jgi:hypothetical protein
MTQARLELDSYTMRVLDVIKGKHGLKNRSEALSKFAEEYGDKYVEPKVDEKILKELDKTYEGHIKKHGHKAMSERELDNLLGLD